MNRKKVLILAVLMIGLFQAQLFSLITSRIEGTVVDKDTGEPVVGAKVYLIHEDSSDFWEHYNNDSSIELNMEWESKTSRQGKFKFDKLVKGEFYLWIYKERYENYGPLRMLPDYIREREQIIRKYTVAYVPRNIKGRIILGEGEVKHIKVKLAKEAVLAIKYTRKTHRGTEPLPSQTLPDADLPAIEYSNFEASFKLKELAPYIKIYPSHKNNGLEVYRNLSGGKKVKVTLWTHGYPEKSFEVLLESGKTTTIEYVLDYTVGSVIHGSIKSKSSGKALEKEDIAVFDSQGNLVRSRSDFKGEFWAKGFLPGKIKVVIDFGRKGTFYLDIKENEIRELNLEF